MSRKLASCASCKGKLLAQSSWSRLNGPGRWSLHRGPWEVLLRPLFWPRVSVWLCSWSVTPAAEQVLGPLGCLLLEAGCQRVATAAHPLTHGRRALCLTHRDTKTEYCTPGTQAFGLPSKRPKVTPRCQHWVHAQRAHPGALHDADAWAWPAAHLVHSTDTNCSHPRWADL